MSKRSAPTHVIRPIKLMKDANIWSIIPDDHEGKDKAFKPVDAGPKAKVPKSFILNYKPRCYVSISLNGAAPEVRFADDDHSFYLSGEEFLTISGSRPHASAIDQVRLEPNQEGDGFCLSRYVATESGMPALFPKAQFDIPKYAAKRLKSKLEEMCDHVTAIQESEEVIHLMFDCVVNTYRAEYRLANNLIPIADQFDALSRLVDTYVSSSVIVKAFLDACYEHKQRCTFNHYNLCELVLAQKQAIRQLLK